MFVGIVFFKQKTAYEMRISDWSSTCALPIFLSGGYNNFLGSLNSGVPGVSVLQETPNAAAGVQVTLPIFTGGRRSRSGERRVGNECVSTFSSRWLPEH